MVILTVNTGSSSVRLGLFTYGNEGLSCIDDILLKTGEDAPEHLLNQFLRERHLQVEAVAHRIVHGGHNLTRSCLINGTVEKEIEGLSPLAPLHNPVALQWIRACRAVTYPGIPHVAVFDTAFYASMPKVSSIYALPKDLSRRHGVRRYGFHGIAHRAMVQRLQKINPDIGNEGKIISIQLGSGCSITAIRRGVPIDTSMGFSPNEGLVMSTRSGDIDPGVIVYLLDKAGIPVNEIDRILNKRSGLKGVSGLSGDMKTLLASDATDARLAIRLYCYRAKKYIGAYAAALGGVDAIIFGGGVGENAPVIRKRVIENMEWCGISLDQDANEKITGKEGRISSEKSAVTVMVIPVDESSVLAEEAVNTIENL